MTRENQANQPNGQSQAAGERKLIEDRLAKTAEIRSRGLDPYPARFNRTHTSVEAVALFQSFEQGDDESDHQDNHIVRVAGRVMARRGQGKASFIDVRDGHGSIQIFARQNTMGDDSYAILDLLDIGDIIGRRCGDTHSER